MNQILPSTIALDFDIYGARYEYEQSVEVLTLLLDPHNSYLISKNENDKDWILCNSSDHRVVGPNHKNLDPNFYFFSSKNSDSARIVLTRYLPVSQEDERVYTLETKYLGRINFNYFNTLEINYSLHHKFFDKLLLNLNTKNFPEKMQITCKGLEWTRSSPFDLDLASLQRSDNYSYELRVSGLKFESKYVFYDEEKTASKKIFANLSMFFVKAAFVFGILICVLIAVTIFR